MKTIFWLILLGVSTASAAQNYWMQRDSVKGPGKSVASAFAINGVGYVVSGLTSSGFVRSMYSYDINQDDWDDAQSIGGLNGGGLSRGSATSFSLGAKGYICLGQGDNTNYLNDVWEYDPALDVWSQKANYAGTARRAAAAFVMGNFAYVGTGQDVSGLTNDFFRYDAQQNQWTAIADFGGTPRKYAVGFSMGTQGYVGTGNDGVMCQDFWQYNVATDTWIQKSNFPGVAREGAVGWGNFPDGYLSCGEDQNGVYCNDVWSYNYFTNTWTARASLPATGRKHAIVFTVGTIAYLGCGYNGTLLDDFYAYTMLTGIAAHENEAAVRIYPMPATSWFEMEIANMNNAGLRLEIHDAAGRDAGSAFRIAEEDTHFRVESVSAERGTYYCSIYNRENVLIAVRPVLLAGG